MGAVAVEAAKRRQILLGVGGRGGCGAGLHSSQPSSGNQF